MLVCIVFLLFSWTFFLLESKFSGLCADYLNTENIIELLQESQLIAFSEEKRGYWFLLEYSTVDFSWPLLARGGMDLF